MRVLGVHVNLEYLHFNKKALASLRFGVESWNLGLVGCGLSSGFVGLGFGLKASALSLAP